MPKSDSAFGRDMQVYDTTIGWRFINPKMEKLYGVDAMGETAENVAAEFSISREDQDAFALRSQERALAAQASGRLAREITPVTIAGKKGATTVVTEDEHPRATSLEALAKLGTPFREGGTITAGNASQLSDGAAACVVMERSLAEKRNLEPLAVYRGATVTGLEPEEMGIGPVYAVPKLLAQAAASRKDYETSMASLLHTGQVSSLSSR